MINLIFTPRFHNKVQEAAVRLVSTIPQIKLYIKTLFLSITPVDDGLLEESTYNPHWRVSPGLRWWHVIGIKFDRAA